MTLSYTHVTLISAAVLVLAGLGFALFPRGFAEPADSVVTGSTGLSTDRAASENSLADPEGKWQPTPWPAFAPRSGGLYAAPGAND